MQVVGFSNEVAEHDLNRLLTWNYPVPTLCRRLSKQIIHI